MFYTILDLFIACMIYLYIFICTYSHIYAVVLVLSCRVLCGSGCVFVCVICFSSYIYMPHHLFCITGLRRRVATSTRRGPKGLKTKQTHFQRKLKTTPTAYKR